MTLVWRHAQPSAPHLDGYDGQLLVGQVVRYEAPAPVHWVGFVRLHPVTGRLATAEEAVAAVEATLTVP